MRYRDGAVTAVMAGTVKPAMTPGNPGAGGRAGMNKTRDSVQIRHNGGALLWAPPHNPRGLARPRTGQEMQTYEDFEEWLTGQFGEPLPDAAAKRFPRVPREVLLLWLSNYVLDNS